MKSKISENRFKEIIKDKVNPYLLSKDNLFTFATDFADVGGGVIAAKVQNQNKNTGCILMVN